MEFQHSSHQQMGLHTLVTEKFKTTTLVLNIQRPLEAGQVTRSALLPNVLTRGTARYPSVRELQRQLDSMYGSYLNGDVYKLGERHIVQFRVEIPNGKYLPGRPDLLEEGLGFLRDVLNDPLREGIGFKRAYVELEKDALKRRVEGLFNNKMQYATVRTLEVMCPDEPYRFYSGGRIEDLAALTPEVLYADYQAMLKHAPMDLFVVGDVDAKAVEALVAAMFDWPSRQAIPVPGTLVRPGPASEKDVEDRFEVTQGQLVLGYRTPVHYASDDHYAMMMYNGLLGGFAHSKLFMNVRERESLAYSVRSRYEAHKGLLLVQAGINLGDHDKALMVIREQLAAMEAGEFTDVELEQTRAMLINTYREAYDSPGALINLAFESLVAGRDRSIEQLIAAIPTIGREDIARVAKLVQPDTVYFLRDRATPSPKEEVAAHARD